MTLRARIGRASFAAARGLRVATVLFFLAAAAQANNITVNSTADVVANDGQCTLREAIISANTNSPSGAALGECAAGAAGLDTIAFNIPGLGVHTIDITLGFLPNITEAVTLDGYTQPGASANTLVVGNNAVLTIVLSLHLLNGPSLQPGADNSTVRGLVINNSPNSGKGIIIGADNVAVEGNFIGTDATGTVAVPVDTGIFINGAANTRIGGTAPAQRNLISSTNNFSFGNGRGINIQLAGNGTLIQGNYIGTNAAGTAVLGNTVGILVSPFGSVSIGDVTIGGTSVGAGNLISGNAPDSGISFSSLSTASIGPVTIQGNIIGLDATGTSLLPNHIGIINHGDGTRGVTLVGGVTAAARNIVSGNLVGIYNEIDTSMVILGNYIGTDITGTVALGNGDGIDNITGSVAIGSSVLGRGGVIAGNLISGNSQDGIQCVNGTTIIQGNFIGTQADGVTPLTNGQTAVLVRSSGLSTQATVGGTNIGEGNGIVHIASNVGVFVQSAPIQVSIRGNSIRANGTATGLGISLGTGFAVTANDACDADLGPNGQQNFPVLTSAVVSGGSVTIGGTLNSTASTTFSLDLFSNVSCSPLGNGEGLTYLGSTTVTTDGTCNGAFIVVLAIPSGQMVITATATDPGANTSEFSACLTASGGSGPTPTPTPTPTSTPTPTPAAGRSFTGFTATQSGIATISFTGGGGACVFASAAFIPLVGGAGSPPAGSAPAGVAFPNGLVAFTTTGCTPGSTLSFLLTLPSAPPAGTLYYKYGPEPLQPAPHWYVLPSVIVGNQVSFTITDGGQGDDDLAANGTIVDQGGPGGPSVSVPLLSPALLLAFGLGLVGAALYLMLRAGR